MYITRKIAIQQQIFRLERRIAEKERVSLWYQGYMRKRKIRSYPKYNLSIDLEKLRNLYIKLELLS